MYLKEMNPKEEGLNGAAPKGGLHASYIPHITFLHFPAGTLTNFRDAERDTECALVHDQCSNVHATELKAPVQADKMFSCTWTPIEVYQ